MLFRDMYVGLYGDMYGYMGVYVDVEGSVLKPRFISLGGTLNIGDQSVSISWRSY